MNPPRIAYLCADPGVPVFGRKGSSIHVQEVIRGLRRRGTRVSLFAARFDGPPPADLADLDLHALPCPRQGDLVQREQACLQANRALRRRLCAAGPFDLVYERYALWSHAGMQYARAHRIPGLLEVNAPLIEEQAAHRGLADRAGAEWVANRVFNEAAALLAVSDEVGEYLRRRSPTAGTVRVIPNGVHPARFPADRTPAWCWPGRKPTFTVGFVGTLKPWHGVPVLIEAFARLLQGHPNARLLLVGDGPERARLEAQVQAQDLAGVTHFAGAVAPEEIPGWLMAMDVAVAPYPRLQDFYYSPLKVYEYLAAGRAVVATRMGQLTRLIQHARNGLLCEPDDAGDLSAQLVRLHVDLALRAQLGAAGRETILAGHTWDHVVDQILELAESVRPPSPILGEPTPAPQPHPRSSRREEAQAPGGHNDQRLLIRLRPVASAGQASAATVQGRPVPTGSASEGNPAPHLAVGHFSSPQATCHEDL